MDDQDNQSGRPKLTGILTGLEDAITYQSAPAKKWTAFYSDALLDEICDEIASNPIGIRQIWKNHPDWPARQMFYAWMKGDSEQARKVRATYDAAREIQIETLVAENLSIIHDELPTTHDIMLAKLRCEEHWRQAGKIAPRKYGDKSTVVNKVEQDEDLNNIKDILHGIKESK